MNKSVITRYLFLKPSYTFLTFLTVRQFGQHVAPQLVVCQWMFSISAPAHISNRWPPVTFPYQRHTHTSGSGEMKRRLLQEAAFHGGKQVGPRRGGLTWASGWPWIPPWTRCPGGRSPPSRTRGFRARPWRDRRARFTSGTVRYGTVRLPACCDVGSSVLTDGRFRGLVKL